MLNLPLAINLSQYAQLAYSGNSDIELEMKRRQIRDFKFLDRSETQCLIIKAGYDIIIAFRGTEPKNIGDWLTDINIQKQNFYSGVVSEGILDAYRLIQPEIMQFLAKHMTNISKLWLTGHSLGAGLATVCAASLLTIGIGVEFDRLVTFGSPRVGDKAFASLLNDYRERIDRFVNNQDIVTRTPPANLGFSHIGSVRYIDTEGRIHLNGCNMWDTFWDRVEGTVEDFRHHEIGLITDHSMKEYQRLIRQGRVV